MTDLDMLPWELDSSQALDIIALELAEAARRACDLCLAAGLPLPKGTITYIGKHGRATVHDERIGIEPWIRRG